MSPFTSTHLRVDGISKSFPDRRVLTDISFIASTGEAVGIIGENGSGKSTLLRIVAGLMVPDAGTVQVEGLSAPRVDASGRLGADLSAPLVGLLHQQPPFSPSETVHDAIERAVAPARAAETELRRAAENLGATPGTTEGAAGATRGPAGGAAGATPGATATPVLGTSEARTSSAQAEARYAAALEEVERLGIWSLDAEIAQALNALGLAEIPGDRLTGNLSGGERARLSLAWLLLSRPDVLLLDEPTNHLDDAAVQFLRLKIATWRGPVLFASHDRAFLDEAATTLVDLDPVPRPHSLVRAVAAEGPSTGMGATRFGGSYSDYLEHRRDERVRWERQFRDEQAELKRLRGTANSSHTVGHAAAPPRTEGKAAKKFYADRNAKVVSRRVSDAQRRVHKLEESQIVKPPRELQFRGLVPVDADGLSTPTQPGTSQVLLSANELSVTGRLGPVSFTISEGEHLLVTGPNGSGKSTLLNLLSRKLAEDAGTLAAPGLRQVGILSQEVSFPTSVGLTVEEVYRAQVGDKLADRVTLSSFGLIDPRDLNRPFDSLSVGQRRRVELAALLAAPPQLLLLDEPTNHLSLQLVEALEQEIPRYPGTVIVASHDRWLRSKWKGRRLELKPLVS